MKNCHELNLSLYLDGESTEAAEHVAHCPHCQAELEEMRALDRLIRGPGPPTLSWPRPAPRAPIKLWLRAALVLLCLGTLTHLLVPPALPKPERHQVSHGHHSYTIEVRGESAQLLQMDIEDELGTQKVTYARKGTN